MNVHEAVKFARTYLWQHLIFHKEDKVEGDYKLHDSLQYLLCRAFNRLSQAWGECNISEKDIHMLVESWIMAQGTAPNHAEPLVLIRTPT